MKVVILDGYTENPGDLSWDWIQSFGYELNVYNKTDYDDIIERAKDADVLVTNKCIIDKHIIDNLPKVKYIQVLATGYNVIDCSYAKEKGVTVCNIPSYSTDGVSQLVFSLLLEMTQQVAIHSQSVHNGDWTDCPYFCYQKTFLTELSGKTFGIIGFGKIGQAVAQIANSFKMNVIYCAPHEKEYLGFGEVNKVSMDYLLENSDVISIHCPLTDDTKQLVNKDFLTKMKKTAYLINTARGGVVNEQDLANALNNDIIAYYGTDVLLTEPPKKDNPLLTCKNCFITPHIAWANIEARTRLMNIFKDNFKAFTEGKMINVVNE